MKADHKRNALLRLKTVRGHLDGVIVMVEREDYCPGLMKQIAALQARVGSRWRWWGTASTTRPRSAPPTWASP